jgi:tetratricopeptide (TPR) repeat protein
MSRIEQIREMLRDDPEDAFLIYALALEHEKAGEVQEAIKGLESLRSKQPDYLPVYYKLGKLSEQSGHMQKAIEYYKTGIQVARKQNDQKTLGELNEALMFLDEGE